MKALTAGGFSLFAGEHVMERERESAEVEGNDGSFYEMNVYRGMVFDTIFFGRREHFKAKGVGRFQTTLNRVSLRYLSHISKRESKRPALFTNSRNQRENYCSISAHISSYFNFEGQCMAKGHDDSSFLSLEQPNDHPHSTSPY